ncbi:MAG: hypothetical protein M0R28_20950 [Pigmentiphaga sp.]|nr:hypothetical protein [Pigmentiphaga sp.]
MKSDESTFQEAVAEQKSDAKPLFRETVQEQIPNEPLLRFFRYSHLPPHLQDISMAFSSMASLIVQTVPRNAERTVALRKLLESKDCAVRAALPEE